MTHERPHGHVVLVTGAGQGIGRAIAKAFGASGATVILAGRTLAKLEEAAASVEQAGGRALPLAVDVTDRVAVTAMMDRVRDEVGVPDVLVNAAGTLQAVGPFWEIDPDAWWHEVDANLRSTALCAWAVLPDMVAAQRGTIINLVTLAVDMRSGYDSAYTASKAGVIRLSTSLAVETEPHGIRVFAVDPGIVKTRMTQQLMDSPIGRKYFPFFQHLPDDSWAPPERTADVCVQLAAGRGGFLSGHVIHVDDRPSRLGWRLIGRLGQAWREFYAMRLASSSTRAATTRTNGIVARASAPSRR
ncbi:MAG: SDR family NAD(P)-dependent oxidoreductase [Chloroflexota bacterium]